MRKIFISVILLLAGAVFFAAPRPSSPGSSRPSYSRNESYRDRILKPESVKKLESSTNCEFSIRTNVSSAEVYINGFYEGRTDLLVKNLRPGYYRIELRKSDYETEKFEIELRAGYRNVYSVDMRKILGAIDIHNLPAMASVYLDDTKVYGNLVEATPGYHQLEIQKFGYDSFKQRVYVRAYEYTDVYVNMTEAAFDFYNFKASRTSINPDYNNLFGKVEFSFVVTNRGSLDFVVLNSLGEEVFRNRLGNFSTWTQNFTWNGKSAAQEDLSDGIYYARLYSGNDYYEIAITIDRGVSYSLMGISTKGSGIGNVPLVFNNGISLIVPYIKTGFILNERKTDNFMDIQLGLMCDFAKHFEFNLALGALPGGGLEDNNQVQFSTSFKIFGSSAAGKASICYGGLFHWGFVREPLPLPTGIDNGNGIGFAAMIGVDFPSLYVGLASDYIIAAEDGKNVKSGSVWKNGVAVAGKISKTVNVDGWFSVNSAIRNPSLPYDKGTDLLWAVDYGGQLLFMFGRSSVMGTVTVERVNVFSSSSFFNFGFGLSYLL